MAGDFATASRPYSAEAPGEDVGWMADAADGGISARQCLVARAGLRWTQAELAEKAQVNRATVAALEDGKKVLANNKGAVIAAFRSEGVLFTSDGVSESVSFPRQVPPDVEQ